MERTYRLLDVYSLNLSKLERVKVFFHFALRLFANLGLYLTGQAGRNAKNKWKKVTSGKQIVALYVESGVDLSYSKFTKPKDHNCGEQSKIDRKKNESTTSSAHSSFSSTHVQQQTKTLNRSRSIEETILSPKVINNQCVQFEVELESLEARTPTHQDLSYLDFIYNMMPKEDQKPDYYDRIQQLRRKVQFDELQNFINYEQASFQ
ncbi:MAG: hypothetical protein H0T62_12630 [Parachlamydiaceae bacterium]|nr:hypothetical protein [Parachlamydiaceae bacterium]